MIHNLEVIQNLRKQINERPEDYYLRLVYADALEETGIEVNVKRAKKIRERSWFRTWPAMVEGYGRISIAGRGGIFAISTYQEDAENPLLEIVRCTMGFWLKHGPNWVKIFPIQRVRITDRVPFLSRFDFREEDVEYLWYTASLDCYPHGEHGMEYLPKNIILSMQYTEASDYHFWRSYHSIRAARLALSDACIAWAKSVSKADSVS